MSLGIPAAPILGSDRAGHLQKVYEPVLLEGGEEIYKGGNPNPPTYSIDSAPSTTVCRAARVRGMESCVRVSPATMETSHYGHFQETRKRTALGKGSHIPSKENIRTQTVQKKANACTE